MIASTKTVLRSMEGRLQSSIARVQAGLDDHVREHEAAEAAHAAARRAQWTAAVSLCAAVIGPLVAWLLVLVH